MMFQGVDFAFSPYSQLSKKSTSLTLRSNDVNSTQISQTVLETTPKTNKFPPKSKAYKRRNVYKSIIRHMNRYLREDRIKMTSLLENNGFSKEQIEKAYRSVKKVAERERTKGMPKKPKGVLNKILSCKNVFVYILQETLIQMINKCNQDQTNKILQKNIEIYRGVCQKYYNRCIEILAQPIIRSVFLI